MSIDALAANAILARVGSSSHQYNVALHGIDTLATIMGALASREGQFIQEFYRGKDGAMSCAGMAALARFTECDDIHASSCMTAGSIAVPVALEFSSDLESYLRAMEAAYATGIALAESAGGANALSDGIWPALFAAPAVAAVACTVALGLSEVTIANAIALALAGVSGRCGRPAGVPSGRWLVYGEAVLKGIRSALAAAHGFSGDRNLVTTEWLSRQSAPELVNFELLQVRVDNAVERADIKPFVAARQGSSAIQAFLAVLESGVSPDEIQHVEVVLPNSAMQVVGRPLDLTNRLSTIAHLGLQLGIAAYQRDRLLDIGREAPFDPRAVAFANKVVLSADPTEDRFSNWPAKVRVRAEGFVVEEFGDTPLDSSQDNSRSLAQWDLVRRKAQRFIQKDYDVAHYVLNESLGSKSYADLRRLFDSVKRAFDSVLGVNESTTIIEYAEQRPRHAG